MKNIFDLLKKWNLLLFASTALVAQNNVGWQPLGPVEYPVNNVGQINGIARVSQIKFHPTDPKTMYSVTSMGGLFISKDEGNNWLPMGTDFIPQARNASVCIDYTDDRILYFSTGDPHYYSTYSGIWKSTNGGKNWAQSNSGIGNRMAVEMLMSPLDHNVIIAATNDGIWKTTNGGASWTVKKSGGNFTQMEFKPVANSSTIYAITHTEFWVSNDMGETWTRTTISGSGIERGGRIAVSKADANVVYVSFVGNFDGGTATPFWKSTNSGASFSQIRPAGNPNLNGYDGNSFGQGNYNYFIAADPLNANIVYAGGHIIWKSTDGGVSWSQATRSWATRIHTDMHQMAFSPYKPNHMYNANDGGIYLSTDGGFVWQIRSNGLAGLESYVGAQSQLNKGIVMAGSQDNGAVIFRNTYWATNMGGDVHTKMECDYLNGNSIYLLGGNGRRKSSVNGAETNLNFPVAGNDGNGNDKEMEFTPLNTSLGFVSHREVYRTTNLGSNPPTWTQITNINAQIKALAASPADVNLFYVVTDGGRVWRSDNITAATPTFVNLAAPGATNIRASIAPIKNNANVVYMSCGNRVYRSADKGASWSNVSGTLPAVNIFKIIHDRYSTNEAVYIATSLGVYYKDNTMSDWVNYSKDLPSIAEKSKLFIYNDGTANSELRVTTGGRGVWRRALYNNVILRPADNPATTTSGLRYEYYEGNWNQIPNFNSLVPVKTGTANAIDISQRNRDDGFGFRFKGYVNVPTDGIYNFHVNSDDGCIVYIGDQVLVDNNGVHGNETEVSNSIGLKAGKHAITIEYFEGAFGHDLLVQYSGPGVSKQAIPGSALFRLPDPAVCNGTGSLTYEIWHNMTGGISSIPVNTTPSVSRTVGDFELAQDYGDSYGSRARGYICAPYTGNYTFWIASDDDSELWLSTDATPANKRKIAGITGATSLRNWYYSSSQQSAPIALVAGQKYYIESLHRDGGGDDHCSVGWQLPSGEFERPIAAVRLSPFTPNTIPTVNITAPANNSAFAAASNITFDAAATDADGSVTRVEFFRNGTSIGFDNTAPYSVTWNNAVAGSYQITAVATDNMGGTGTSSIVTITVNDLRTPENPSLTEAGQDYKYYEGNWSALPDFSTLTAVKTGTVTNFDLTPRNRNDQFAFTFSGFINVPTDGQYTFYTTSDDGSKLYIGTTQVVNNDGLHGSVEASGGIGLKAGKHAITVSFFEQGGGEQLSVSYAGPGISKQVIPATSLFRIPTAVSCSGTGTMTREVWTGITGTAVSAVPVASIPSSTGTVSLLEGPVDAADNYGSRLRGYVCPPYTGAYTFWISSDDDSELWLSTNDQPSAKTRIAYNTGFVNYRTWEAKATQKSASINLTAGQKYYVEVLHKDGVGGDHVSVGWQLPTGVMERPVTGNRISPYINMQPTVSLATNGTSFNAPAAVTLTATASDADGSVVKVEFLNGTSLLGDDATSPYSFTWNNVAAGSYTLTAKVYDNSGAVISSVPVTITVVNTAVTVGTVYQHCDYSTAGYGIALEVGDYNLAAMQAKGIANNDISSVKVSAGYELVLYKNNDFTGGSIIIRADDNCLVNEAFNDSTTSLRVRLVTNSAPAVSITSPSNGNSFTTGTTIALSANATDSDGSITRVEFFRGTTSIGFVTASPFTYNWTGASAGSYSITAIATDNSGATTTSNPVSITVTTPNVAPAVSITSPSNGNSFTTGTTIALTANATDSDGSITRVEFFRGTTSIGFVTASPFTYNWTGASAGSYSITAVATDNSGAATTSAAVSITVNTPNTPPTVSITAPANNNTYNAPATINIAANASDNGGTITKVEFFNGTNYLGEDATSPYTFSWTNVAAGNYSITAKATDNSNTSATSAAVSVIVNAVDNCSGLSVYVESTGGYVEGSQVKNGGNIYQCRAWPNSGWCNGAAWAYAPGTGAHWTDAWTLVGPCTSAPIPTPVTASSDEMEVTTIESFPNPFESATTIKIKNKAAGNVSVVVVNNQGVKVADLFNGQMKTGAHELVFDASTLAEGSYYCRIVSEKESKVISLNKVNRPKMKF